MNNKYIKYVVTFIIGFLMAYAVFSYKNLLEATNTPDIIMILSDGFLLPAVVIGGFGILLLVSNGGAFDIFIYGFGTFRETLKRKVDRDPNFPGTYFDFKEEREKKVSVAHFLVVGGICLILAAVLNGIFYYV